MRALPGLRPVRGEASARLRAVAGSRTTMSVVGALVLVLLAALGYVVAADPLRRTVSYCAIMADGIGLYAGNHVTMRGITVGTVTSVRPENDRVRVDFSVDAEHPVLADASATTVSRNITTDRDLAVLHSGTVRDTWDPARCLTKTLTPKSLTETLRAVAELSRQLLGPAAGSDDAIGRLVTQLNAATSGTGPQLNAIVGKLGAALDHPDAAIGHLAGVVDSLAALAESVAAHWDSIDAMVLRLETVLHQVNDELFSETVGIIDSFRRVLPMLNDITTMFGDPIFLLLDASVPLLHLVGAGVATLRQILDMLPVITGAFAEVLNPRTGAPGLTYAPPRVAVPTPDAERLCAAVEPLLPGHCTGKDGIAHLDLARTVLALAGAR
ncbi:MlaD family protein [Nocardia blacklockiae]|uniref:MlaD family protein n=1 Tax=Nocardia blacklockiae TaxID=480036 RepID=UPI001894F246|nr:MlaD family protein [Nocardia blacklockiae]MBF6175943.1 MCE family protein [Nocardia blacklockiae]